MHNARHTHPTTIGGLYDANATTSMHPRLSDLIKVLPLDSTRALDVAATTVLGPPLQHSISTSPSVETEADAPSTFIVTDAISTAFLPDPATAALDDTSSLDGLPTSTFGLTSLFNVGPSGSSTTTTIGPTPSGRASTQSTTLDTSTAIPSQKNMPPVVSVSSSSSSTFSMFSPPTPTSSPELASQQCHEDPVCAARETDEAHRRSVIAGSVVGVVGGCVIIFALVMCWRKKLRRRRAAFGAVDWLSDKPKARTSDDTPQEQDRIPVATTMEPDLGEPGPALTRREPHKMPADTRGRSPRQRPVQQYTKLTSRDRSHSRHSGLSDPFRTPTEPRKNSAISLDGQMIGEAGGIDPTRSQIGLALTRYSTANTEVEPATTCPPSLSKTDANSSEYLDHDNLASNHNRVSSISAISNGTDITHKDDDPHAHVLYIGKARPAKLSSLRRHSLTPRIINIVANTHSRSRRGADGAGSDRSDDEVDTDTAPTSVNATKSTLRARSASPMKSTNAYSGSPVKLTNHFGIVTWGRESEPGRTSSEIQGRTRLPSRAREQTRFSRGRSVKEETAKDLHISYPPTSYPMLGRTMSEVKRTLKERKEKAFTIDELGFPVGVSKGSGLGVHLPGSVTVHRGTTAGRGKVLI